jgi:hypothetical protein
VGGGRIVVGGGSHPIQKMRLRIIYSKIWPEYYLCGDLLKPFTDKPNKFKAYYTFF